MLTICRYEINNRVHQIYCVLNDESGHKATSLLIVRLINCSRTQSRSAAQNFQQYDKPTNPYIDPVQLELSSFISAQII